jgi:Serine/threonine protein kinase
MTPDRWQQVDKIFQAAIELGPDERTDFLNETCGTDEELRREVESLISSDSERLSLFDAPAFETAVGLFATDQPELKEGQVLGNYKIISLLGVGGMGEVYLAEDSELGRRIAIKLLPAEFTKDKERLRRFRQEARAASALNHPNILTIHQIRQIEGRHFMATEFVDGETLRQRLKRSPLNLSETLEIATQIASALSAAHKAGIVHRDIKPENIMLRPDGYVKVLDFGLAKLTEQYEQTRGDVSVAERVDVSSGLVMGTVKYMSPEQAQGLQVDQRSDIFSFGVVLYEMITGEAPFKGENSNQLVGAILKKTHSPLIDVPVEIQNLINKVLNKKPEERYQTSDELLTALKVIRGEVANVIGSDVAPQSGSRSTAATSGTTATTTVSTIEYVVSGIKRHKTGASLVLASLVVVVLGATFGLNFRNRARPLANQMRIEPVPGTETAGNVALSPDGKFIAFSATGSLFVREVGTNNSWPIVADNSIVYPTYSPSADAIFYVSHEKLFRIPVQGGEAKAVMSNDNGHGPISFSSDGKQFVFSRYDEDGSPSLVLANVDGSGEKVLASIKNPGHFSSPAWSPDGSLIACSEASGEILRVVALSIATGEHRWTSNFRWKALDRLAWLPDGSGLVASAMDAEASPKQLWLIPYPTGEPHKITNDLDSYVDVSISADGKTLVTLQSSQLSNIWIAPSGEPTNAKPIAFGERKLAGAVSWTPDNRIVCPVNNAGQRDIWIVDKDGTNPRQLTANAGKHLQPQASPDGRYIVFSSNRAGNFNIWRMNIDGSNPLQLTKGDGEVHPTVSPDGLWVVYSKGGVDTPINEKTVWKVPINGGDSVELSSIPSSGPAVSPDGSLVACWYMPKKAAPSQIALIPIAGGPPVKTFDVNRASTISLQWTPDGQNISYLDIGKNSNIWNQPINGGPPVQVTQLNSERILGFSWSRNFELAYLRVHDSQDVVLISDFR